jgi:hypothetical protein
MASTSLQNDNEETICQYKSTYGAVILTDAGWITNRARKGNNYGYIFCITLYCGMLDEKGCDGMIVDDYSEIRVVSGNIEGDISGDVSEGAGSRKNDTGYIEIPSGCKYFSLLAAGGDAHGVTIRDTKYNIEDADLCTSFPLGVSNEVPEGNIARVSVREGRLFVITVVSE